MKNKQIPGFDGVHKQHEKDKATKRAIKKGFPLIDYGPPPDYLLEVRRKAKERREKAKLKAPPEKITLLLTLADKEIKKGITGELASTSCPIVRAMRKSFPEARLSATTTTFKDGGHKYRTPSWLESKIRQFDETNHIAPFTRKATFTLIKEGQ